MPRQHATQTRRQVLQWSLAAAGLVLGTGCGLVTPRAKLPVVGYLGHTNSPANGRTRNYDAFVEGLRQLGWIDGQTLSLQARWTEGRTESLPDLAAELIRVPVDVIVADGPPGARAAAALTDLLPIVFASAPDPLSTGLVCSLARPCGNVTGLSNLAEGLDGKRLELLKDTIPGLTRAAVLWHQPQMLFEFQRTQTATQTKGVQLLSLGVADLDGILPAVQAAISGGAQALITLTDGLTQSVHGRIVELAAENRLPGMYQTRDFPDAGGLMSYGPNAADQNRRAATYVDKILKGAKPADLPVEQPTTFDFIINLKTAQALGLTIPQTVLQQATEIIQ